MDNKKEWGLWILGTLSIGIMVTGLFFSKESFQEETREQSGKIVGRCKI